jgi:hypothetical protein
MNVMKITDKILFLHTLVAVLHTLVADLHTVVAGLLARSRYPECPATGHLSTGFSWFPFV